LIGEQQQVSEDFFSAEAIQQAASASPQGNNVPGEDIPEALPINNQGIDAIIPEALPANMPAPPPFQKKSVTGHANTKRNLIVVSSSVGGDRSDNGDCIDHYF